MRGEIIKVDDKMIIVEDENHDQHEIDRDNICGINWTLGWQGTVIVDDELEEVFFHADTK